MIRPQPARWFEVLAARDDVARVLEALAATRAAELEARPAAGLPPAIADLAPLFSGFSEFALRYRGYWPPGRLRPSALAESPVAAMSRCLASLREWAITAEPLVAALQDKSVERAELVMWRALLDTSAGSTLDLSRAASAQSPVCMRLVLSAPESEPAMPAGALVRRFAVDGTVHALVCCNEADLRALSQQAAARKSTLREIPAWMQGDPRQSAAYVSTRLEALGRETAEVTARLEALHERHDLAYALGDAECLHWVVENVRALESDELFCWVTGWTSELRGDRLELALERSGARAILHYPPPPDASRAPLILANPSWARPFEVFSRALGVPARTEADPTILLAFVVPLMFGYMFGDVGQGVVIALAGLVMQSRWPIARLFVVGGVSAAIFGLLFGSVFSIHGIVAPIWIDALADPLTVLLVPLYGGAVLLAVGLLLRAIEAHWRGELREWLQGDLWLLIVYVALLASVLAAEALYFAAAAAVAFCIGRAIMAHRAPAGFAAIAELVERTLQILINTLSFARVGAFALAHAGLSSAIVALMDAASSSVTRGLVIVLGNVIVLVLEGLVVSIQTTRLVLFEFFTRFLVAPGRVFRPMPAPPLLALEP